MLKVVIPEGIPSLNKGEAAILEGIHEMLSLCGQHELRLFSPDSRIQDDSRNYGHLAKPVGGTSLYGTANDSSQKSVRQSHLHYYIGWCKSTGYSHWKGRD